MGAVLLIGFGVSALYHFLTNLFNSEGGAILTIFAIIVGLLGGGYAYYMNRGMARERAERGC